ncbi:MAG: 1,4-alpha-glucan branching protein domain-containing protein, partial [Puniceicoccales bacterium]
WEGARQDFTDKHKQDLPAAFARLAQQGKVELLTTAMTHGFLPAHQNAVSRRLQIELGVQRFTELTGIDPAGFWLPECAYFPGLENDLAAAGVRWFGVEDMGGPRVRECPNGVTAIARDTALSRVVWDARSGYPGHAAYREFHRDAAHELSNEQAGLYRTPDGTTLPLGMKYWAVTGGAEKSFYEPDVAIAQARSDADDFAAAIDAESASGLTFLPFDAELFGHWWFEGPTFLSHFMAQSATGRDFTLSTPTAALADMADLPVKRPIASTWGRQADFSYWVNHETDWIYPLLAQADATFAHLAESWDEPDFSPEQTLRNRALRQLIRELLLAQASDWPFMIRGGATANYARERIQRHLARFHYLATQLTTGTIDANTLAALESLDPILPELPLDTVL